MSILADRSAVRKLSKTEKPTHVMAQERAQRAKEERLNYRWGRQADGSYTCENLETGNVYRVTAYPCTCTCPDWEKTLLPRGLHCCKHVNALLDRTLGG